jgi:hypothetical protein
MGATPDNPVPFGQLGRVGGWDVRVISIGTLERDGFDRAPPAAFAFVLLTIEATRIDAEPESALFLASQLLGPSRVERGAMSNPNCFAGSPSSDTVHQGGTVRSSQCISVLASDINALVAKIGGLDLTELWFATS